ncbi:hypothetical protein [Novosphingobium aquimarinum]|uniref:hypothetical protein n=1 Tax=Novosphingobium aquimarinum TaxID=2682494 RepID=UPI0012EB12F6|nr:hypothetical protein [Novosphingobium aquimarinum]
MSEGSAPASRQAPASREERLAAKLRENLRRRKAQSRQWQDNPIEAAADAENESSALPKSDPKS